MGFGRARPERIDGRNIHPDITQCTKLMALAHRRGTEAMPRGLNGPRLAWFGTASGAQVSIGRFKAHEEDNDFLNERSFFDVQVYPPGRTSPVARYHLFVGGYLTVVPRPGQEDEIAGLPSRTSRLLGDCLPIPQAGSVFGRFDRGRLEALLYFWSGQREGVFATDSRMMCRLYGGRPGNREPWCKPGRGESYLQLPVFWKAVDGPNARQLNDTITGSRESVRLVEDPHAIIVKGAWTGYGQEPRAFMGDGHRNSLTPDQWRCWTTLGRDLRQVARR